MKIKSITVESYKKFVAPKTIDFTNSLGEINTVSVLVGDNGTGKTSILQAIVLLLAGAIRDKFTVDDLNWPGFDYRHIQSGKIGLRIEIDVEFSPNELNAVREYAHELQAKGIKVGEPSSAQSIKVVFDYKNKRSIVRGRNGEYFQFKAHQYAKQLSPYKPNISTLFENVGNIYWYTEQRTSDNITNLFDNTLSNLDAIRVFLASAYSFHQAIEQGNRQLESGQFDFYSKLKELYETVFPDRTLAGATPRFDIYEKAPSPDFFFMNKITNEQYEIAGMSAGERAIFPILMDFARWNINNSIIIIDEIELHLHPPLQQTLVRALSKIGKNNQFILTTHSNGVLAMLDDDQIIRM